MPPTPAIVATFPPSLQLLYQKQQEYSGLQALRHASGDLVKRVEALADMTNVMADGGEAIGGVLQNWSYVFHILSQLDKSAPPPNPDTTADPDHDHEPEQDEPEPEPVPQMVRLPYAGEGEL